MTIDQELKHAQFKKWAKRMKASAVRAIRSPNNMKAWLRREKWDIVFSVRLRCAGTVIQNLAQVKKFFRNLWSYVPEIDGQTVHSLVCVKKIDPNLGGPQLLVFVRGLSNKYAELLQDVLAEEIGAAMVWSSFACEQVVQHCDERKYFEKAVIKFVPLQINYRTREGYRHGIN